MTLSTTDVGRDHAGWTCRELSVDELLQQGEHLAFDAVRVLRWLIAE